MGVFFKDDISQGGCVSEPGRRVGGEPGRVCEW